jgi:hypothetical protein
MSASPFFNEGHHHEVEAAKPSQRAYSSSVLRSDVRETTTTAPASEGQDAFKSNLLARPVDCVSVAEGLAERLPGGAGQPPANLLYQREVNCTRNSKRLTEYLSRGSGSEC